MAAGDTLFGDHEQLIARVPSLLKSTEEALTRGVHPMIVAARFHGFYEYRLERHEVVSKVTGTTFFSILTKQSPDFPKPGLCHVPDFLYLWT